jgi:predicted nuclease of predicted toxin-antitoxin system
MRLLADLHIAPRTIEYLKSLGHDVVRVSQVLPPTSADHEIIAYAGRDRRAILTQDLDFSAEIAVSRQAFPSVILLRLSSSRIESNQATAYSNDFGFSICFDAFRISIPTIFPVLS